ncbi:hypothetical protein FisN_18Hu164 [Fistulifera solaris]|jgi:hypothetical protein|uniref:RRP15-like protein n=1 Tax=Fistulifera solaris TaxID=1519565 RepID=A0A1Z5JV82_FISSO|nr:hypothetical protein FisN_18Hu164 [Fistulifera solaris]|eukprot:GAX17953.1 hypothetical protein FisN_18Hu164 [Fistulifera solaris]
MGSKKKQAAKLKREVVEVDEEDLNRFAGSSDEEENNHHESSDYEDQAEPAKLAKTKVDENQYDADEQSDDSPSQTRQDESDSSEDDSDEEQERDRRSKGMASAMARILGTTTGNAQSAVLSKTKTPIQKLAEEEKQKEKEMREKRQANREKRLVAFHEPLSVASLSTFVNPGKSGIQSSISKELEQERVLRRVATRGVVALFNAISQHQNKTCDATDSAADPKNEPVRKMTKHGFLDMIKAKATSLGKPDENKEDVNSTSEKKQNWNALQDDFLLKPKKNWDQESSSEEDDDDEIVEDDDSGVEDEPPKKRKISSQ